MSHFREHGLVVALLALVATFSLLTWTDQSLDGRAAGNAVADAIASDDLSHVRVVVFTAGDTVFGDRLRERLGDVVVAILSGGPFDCREWMNLQPGPPVTAIAVSAQAQGWTFLNGLDSDFPGVRLYVPPRTSWPAYLRTDNLRNILSQIAVIALVAVGMTLVIATGGIDLSVGSLMALGAVLAALLIRDVFGNRDASPLGMVTACVLAIAVCAACGLATGTLITQFRLPSFIATLGMMWIARGVAFKLSGGQSINQVPDSFSWLGREATFAEIPNVVTLDALLFVGSFVLLNSTVLGRYILAVGSNERAALLAGVPIRKTLLFVYTASAALAGLGGIVLASQLQAGDPKFGQEYELYVITAVVVGGTSLRGGQGRIVGTLLGALLISVVQVGMDLIHVDRFSQMIVLGAILLSAVLIDRRG